MTLTRFGDVVTLCRSRTADPVAAGIERFVGLEHIEPDNLHIRGWGLVAEGTTFTNTFRRGQVLFGKRRAYQRKVAVAEFDGVCSSDIYVFDSKDPNILLPVLLPFICQSEGFFQHAVDTSAGSLSPRTNWSHLANYEFQLPSIDEQRRIANLLWAADSLITAYSDLFASARTLMQSRLSSFVLRFDEKKYLRKVSDLLTYGPRNGYSPPTNAGAKGYRTVSTSAVSDGEFVPYKNIKFADVDYEKVRDFLVQRDDVLVVRGNGNRCLTGKCGIASQSFEDLFYPDLLIRIRFDDSQILPTFAVLQWNTPWIHRSLIARAKSTNGIWKINGQDIRNHSLIVPPLDEQEMLIQEFAAYSNAIANLVDCRQVQASLKGLLLHSHF